MTRIFPILAVTAVGLMVVNLLLGFSVMGWNETASKLRSAKRQLDELERGRRITNNAKIMETKQALDVLRAETKPIRQRALIHMGLGVSAALATVLVNSISITYFVGTSRWVKEVVETYQMNQAAIAKSNAFKRRSFPWAVASMLTVVGIVALGGASDPGNSLEHPEMWTNVHLASAFLGITFVAWSFFRQYSQMVVNFTLINEVMDEVKRIRDERGLTDEIPHEAR